MATILDCGDDGAVREAARMLEAGSLVVVPTDTVYGLAVHPQTAGARQLLCDAKGRDEGKPVVLLVASTEQVETLGGLVDARAKRLMEEFWPGALTLVVGTTESTQGFRMPDHAVVLSLLAMAGGSLYVTSANRSGEEPAATASEAVDLLGDSVAGALEAGVLGGGKPSTVVDVSDETLVMLREGAIPWREIEKVWTG